MGVDTSFLFFTSPPWLSCSIDRCGHTIKDHLRAGILERMSSKGRPGFGGRGEVGEGRGRGKQGEGRGRGKQGEGGTEGHTSGESEKRCMELLS